MTITIDTIHLQPGERVERTYWARAGHYDTTPHVDQEHAEAHARQEPTSIECLSYEEREAGVIPAGHGYVELRAVVTRPDGSSLDSSLVRYAVYRQRQGAA